MLMPALISLLVGMVLAQRFRVLILAPLFLLTLLIALAVGMVRSDAAWSLGLTAGVTIIGLQVGYMLGIGIRHLLALGRLSRLRSVSLPNSLEPNRPAR
jgi:hypothetical protein